MFEAVEPPTVRNTCAPLHDMARIAPRLYMGAWPDAAALKRLHRAGFSAVVYCAVERGVPQAPPGLRIIRAPMHDTLKAIEAPAQMPAAARAAAHVVSELNRGGRVLVSCNQGRNRSGLVVALVLLALDPRSSADSIVRGIRRDRGSAALANPVFVELLHAQARGQV